jgi:hypothetical protein
MYTKNKMIVLLCAIIAPLPPISRGTYSLLLSGGIIMIEDNYNYRTSQTLLRNQFSGKGKLKIPIIPKFEAKPDDFDN